MNKKILKVMTVFCLMLVFLADAGTSYIYADEYEGIEIDGDFSDWDSVHKTEINDGKLNKAAFVFDGDNLYFYIDACLNYTASMAGNNNNGKFSVTTDLGNTMLFQLINSGTVPEICGVTGAEISHSDLTWGHNSYLYEFSIPVRELPGYRETLSFGVYLGATYVGDVADIKGGRPNTTDFEGIIFDGEFVDWDSYPHTLLQYSGSGTHENEVDAEGALYLAGGYLYGHVTTSMRAHMDSNGGDFTSGITIGVNELPDIRSNSWFWPKDVFYPQFITIDEAGNINYDPKLSGLSRGTHVFYLIDSQGWKNATNAAQWEDPSETYIYDKNHIYGMATIVIGPSEHEMEFILHADLIADKFFIEEEELHAFCAQFSRLGQQWFSTAGTSTGPLVGVSLCIVTVGAVFGVRKFKRKSLISVE